jgi:hypothetical protein
MILTFPPQHCLYWSIFHDRIMASTTDTGAGLWDRVSVPTASELRRPPANLDTHRMGLIFVASVPVPSQWFTKRRSLANACAAAGSGFGGLVYSLATNAMITSIGLAWTFRVLAVVCFVVNSSCSLLIRDRNKAVGSVHVAFNWDLFKRPSFLLYEGWLILSMIPYCALVFSIVDYCQAVGLSQSQASLVGALLNREFIGVTVKGDQ